MSYRITEHGAVGTPFLAQLEKYTVGQWCPSPDGTGKPEAVVLTIDVSPPLQFKINERSASGIGLRLGSRDAVNVLISVLARHRDEVFPQERRP